MRTVLVLALSLSVLPLSACKGKAAVVATSMPETAPAGRAAYLVLVAVVRSESHDDKEAADAFRAAFDEFPALGTLDHPVPVRKVEDEYRLVTLLRCGRWKRGIYNVRENHLTYGVGGHPIDILHLVCSADRKDTRALHFRFRTEFDRY